MDGTRPLGVRAIADGIGMFGSAACAVHCVAAPVALVVGTTLPASFFTNEAFHQTLLWGILPAALLAFGIGCWQHKDRTVLLVGAFGLVGLATPVLVPHETLGEVGERGVTLASAALLIAAHVRNFRLCRAGDCAHAD